MAYIANTAFEARITNHRNDDTANITGIFLGGNDAADICSAGFLCTRAALAANAGYPSALSISNENTWNMVEAESTDLASTPIYACNPHDVNEVTDPVTGATFKVGANTLGIPAPAGKPVTFTKIDFLSGDKRYRFGVGNLSAALGANTFFTIANGLLTPAAQAPTTTGAPYFVLRGTGTFTEGAYASAITYVDVEAHVCLAVA